MRQWLAAVLAGIGALAVVQGCTANGTNLLNVTQRLRLACSGYTASDSVIQSYIQEAIQEKDNGVSKQDLLAAVVDACRTQATGTVTTNCEVCASAVIDHVYGQ